MTKTKHFILAVEGGIETERALEKVIQNFRENEMKIEAFSLPEEDYNKYFNELFEASISSQRGVDSALIDLQECMDYLVRKGELGVVGEGENRKYYATKKGLGAAERILRELDEDEKQGED